MNDVCLLVAVRERPFPSCWVLPHIRSYEGNGLECHALMCKRARAIGPGAGRGPAAPETGLLARFRADFRRCLSRRGDMLFCLADAVLCADGRVSELARLSLVPEFGRGHGRCTAR